jgi:hypothetical protein
MRARLASLAVALSLPATALGQYSPQYPPPPQAPPPYTKPAQYPPQYGPRLGPPEQGLVLGGRVGFGFPAGDLFNQSPMTDLVGDKVPIWLELGYRFNRHVRTDLYFEFAPTGIKDAVCFSGSCTGDNFRVGIDAQYHFTPYGVVDPWLGLGFGWEWLHAPGVIFVDPVTGNVFSIDQTWSGWELPLIQGGFDFPVAPNFTIGPYASFSLAEYTHYSQSGPRGLSFSQSISDRATHEWFQFGVKFTANL